jgi:hypothetical protein
MCKERKRGLWLIRFQLVFAVPGLNKPSQRKKWKMHPEELFLNVLAELRERHRSGTEYDLIACSRNLRQLLMDGTSLMDVVNRRHRLRIRFEISDTSKLPEFEILKKDIEFIHSALDPEVLAGLPRLSLNKDQLLATYAGRAGGTEFSVGDIISYTANSLGIHFDDNPREGGEEVLRQLGKILTLAGVSAGISTLEVISRIVLRGLKPLEQAIIESRKN